MEKVIAINGSPHMDKGHTGLILNSFIEGMEDKGSKVELFYPSQLNIKPCSCGNMYCWNNKPGECCIKDDMQSLYLKLKTAEILILATPVYIPLPGDMQNFLNRLCPLLDPVLVNRQGRTRARFRDDVNIRKIALVATSGWWELGNFDTVLRIVKEFTEDASVEFAGAVLRPHSPMMRRAGKITADGQSVLNAVKQAGIQLVKLGKIEQETLSQISRPLIPLEEYI